MNKFWNFIKNEASEGESESIELRIDGTIIDDDDAWIYEWLGMDSASPNKFREELKQYDGKDITVWIDSYGGDVFAAAGIYNALKEHSKNGGKIIVKIDGKAMSAASIIAMAGDKIMMSPVSIMMIHNPLSAIQGYASDMRKQADILDEIKESLINAYVNKTGKSHNKISELMDDETYMSANTAVKQGFADEILYADDQKGNVTNYTKDFAFNRLSIQNNINESIKHLFELEIKNNSNKNKKEEIIVDLKELKEKYPDVYKDAYNEGLNDGKTEGIKNERERLKGIDEIAAHADIKIVNKAKYDEPMDAKDLAIEIVKADGYKGKEYLDDIEKDSDKSNVKDVKPADKKPDDDNPDGAKIKNAANKIASFFSRKEVK